MSASNLTTDDLYEFGEKLMVNLKKMLKEHAHEGGKRWLKSGQVRKILGISEGTLQHLRLNGTLPYSKIGGGIYYDYANIRHMLQSNKTYGPPK
jgi:hypothetical protein